MADFPADHKTVQCNGELHFNYGKSYLERTADRSPAIPIYEPELPLQAGALPLPEGMAMPGCIRDAAPDAWGRRVTANRKLGIKGTLADTAELDELTYLLESGSDRDATGWISTLRIELNSKASIRRERRLRG